MRYVFGEFELDLDTFALTRQGEPIQLQPKVFDVLRYLIENRGRVVSKQELLEKLWAGEHVNESAVPWSVSHARKALGQKRGDKSPVETVHGRGYSFVSELSIIDEPRAVMKSQPPPPPSAKPADAQGPGAFVGRGSVMQQLAVALEAARGGQGRLCLLMGEAGIGKTRCAQELSRRAQQLGMLVLTGRSLDAVGAPPFWPWVQVLRELRSQLPELETEVGRVLSALDSAVDGDKEGPAPDTTTGRFWLLDSMHELLRKAAQHTPVLLVLDDVHWMDASSAALLAMVAPELKRTPMLVVGTQRDAGAGGANQAERRLAGVARHAEAITLGRLDRQQVAELVGEAAGGKAVPALAKAIHDVTAGNPLFVHEALRSLVAQHGAEQLAKLDVDGVTIPEGARELVRGRLQALDDEARRMLELASVLGESIDLSVLSRVAGLPLDQILERLDRACAMGTLTRDGPHQYRFSHALARSVLYDDLAVADRVALHRRAGEALAARSDGEPRFSEIARHYYLSLAAGGYADVTRHARAAAEAATRVFAFDEAVTYYGWALEAQAFDDAVEARARADLLLRAGSAERSAGRTDDSRETLRRAIEIARAHSMPDVLVRAARLLRPTFAMGAVPDPLALDALEHALRELPDRPSHVRIVGLSQLACLPPHSLKIERSKELSAQAVELAREIDDASGLFEALRARLYSLSGAADVDAQAALVEEILALEQASGRASLMSIEAHAAAFGAGLLRCDMDAADRALSEMGETARALRMPEVIWYHDRLSAQLRFHEGKLDEAYASYERLRRQARRMRLSYGRLFYTSWISILRAEREGPEAVVAGFTFGQRQGITPEVASGYRALGARYMAAVGRQREARALLDAIAGRDFEEIPRDIAYLNTLANLALAAVALDDHTAGARLYELMAPHARFNTPNALCFYMGSVSHYLGLLSSMAGDEEAEVHYEHALEDNARLRFPMQLARTRVAYGRFLLERDGEGDRAQARSLAAEAGDVARRLELAPLIANVERLQADLG